MEIREADSQSLCHFLHHELSEYHRLLAVLESQMTMSASNNGSSDGANTTSLPAEGSGLTLLRLGLWTEEMRLKMKMMAQVVDDARRRSETYSNVVLLIDDSHTWRRAGLEDTRTYEPWRPDRPDLHGAGTRRGQ